MARRPAKTIHAYGARVARPLAAGWVELVSYTVPQGRMLLADLIQFAPDTAALVAQPLVLDPGMKWEVREAEGSGANPKALVVSPANGLAWTRNDGLPFVRGIVVPGGRRLVFGVNFDPATAAAGVTYLAGAILGVEVDDDVPEEQLLELLARR